MPSAKEPPDKYTNRQGVLIAAAFETMSLKEIGEVVREIETALDLTTGSLDAGPRNPFSKKPQRRNSLLAGPVTLAEKPDFMT